MLWDMDGTIVDTEPYWIECEYELVEEFGGHWDDAKAHSLVGNDLRESARILQEQGSVDMEIDDIVNRLLDGVVERVRRRVPWRPGARELLAGLNAAGIPCALVTMSWSRFALAVVDALPPNSFEAIVTGDMVSRGKPHPEPYVTAANVLGVHPHACVAIEDSPTGVRSAVDAGCRTIAVPNVLDMPPSREYQRLDSLDGIDPGLFGLTRLGPPRRRSVAEITRDVTRHLDRSTPRRPSARAPQPQHAPRRLRPIVALVALFAVAAGLTTLVRRHDPAPLPVIAMAGWAPYWVLDDATETVASVGTHFAELSPFWFETHGAVDVRLSRNLTADDVEPLLSAARSAGALVVPAVADATDAGEMAAILANADTRRRHVDTLVGLARTWQTDGIDIDYEKFAFADDRSTWATTSVHWIEFLRELAAALHADGRILTVAVPPIYDSGRTVDSGYWVYDYAAMGDIVDRIRIMAYDYSTSSPGPIAPLEWVRSAVRAAKDAVDDDEVLWLGVPLYGRNWVVDTRGTCPDGTPGRVDPNLREVARLVERYAIAATTVDPTTGDESFVYERESSDATSTCTQTREVHFVGPAGARDRVDIARSERIGGVVFWALGFETPEVWDAVLSVVREPSATTAVAP
ncbi:MAG: HAD-IA family hydrolase [Ilumatobacteraceae bacterium]